MLHMNTTIINNIYLTINVTTPQAASQLRTTLEETLLKGIAA